MKNGKYRIFLISICLLSAFALWTAAVCFIGVQPIGPQGSRVGLAGLNGFVSRHIGVHMDLYIITDWLGLVPVAFALGFALLGLVQWMRRRSILKVDRSLFILGGFYIVVAAVYILFEALAVNYRPVLIDGYLETSYPSSTTMLALCVMPTSLMQLSARIKKRALKSIVSSAIVVFTAFMVTGRLLSGVHWFSDIIGGVLFSAGLVGMYKAVAGRTGVY